jgi:hypothetical protein
VYSVGIGVMFKDGTTSYVYHIPGKDKGTNTPGKYANSFGGGSGELDTYISEDYYPANQGYPDEFGDGNTHIRHHIIPSNRFEPLFDNENSFNRIRVFFNNIDIPPALRDEIQKVILYREPRNTPEKRSKISQGFLTNMYIGATTYNNERSKDADDSIIVGRSGDAISGFHYRKNFGFFNAQINTYWDMGEYVNNNALFSKTNFQSNSDKDLSSHHGFYYSVRKLDEIAEPTDSTLSLDATTREEYIKMGSIMNSSTLAWMGPEALLSDGVFINPDSLKGASLTRIAQINTNLTTYKQDAKFEDTNSKRFIALADTLNMFYRATGIYNSLVGGVEEIEFATFINNGVKKRVEGLSPYEVDNSWSGKFLYLHTKTNAQQSTETQGNVVDIAYSRDPSTPYGNLTLFKDVTNSDAPSGSSANQWNEELDIFDITRNIRNQYGRIENSQYVPVRIINSTEFNTSNPRDYLGTYGDTYVTKYTTVNKNLFSRYFTFLKLANNNPTFYQYTFDDDDEGDTRIFTTARIFESRYIPTIIPGNVYGSAVECFIESDINTYYRYSSDNEVPYYPRETIKKVFSAVPNQEENRNYNVQYSLDNILKTTYVSRPIFDDALTEFPNRTIYSERSNEDSKVDEYQIFKQNSFYDLPEDTGEIIDTFVWNNDLYSHTAKALWKNFVNTVTREANSIGDVVLGTGDLFSLPSQKILTSDGGYAGTLNQFGNALTPHGYFFVDTLQRKVFKLTNNLEEISLQGMQQWFDENIRKQITGRDNPFWGYGITMGWDNEYKKLLITQKGTASDFTISYYPVRQGWGSFHNYIPNTYIEFDKFLYSIYNKNTGAERYQHNSNIVPYGDFAGNGVFPASVRFISNDRFHDEKAFDNFHIHSRSFDNVIGDRTDFQSIDLFTTMQCVTPYQDSGELDVLTTNAWDPVVANNEVLARWKKSHFQITIPRDNQEANLDNADGWEVASRLKGKYLETTFTYDNLNNREFIVNFIQYLYRIIAR